MSERTQMLENLSRERGLCGMPTHFMCDLHSSALGQFAHLPHYEKVARAMAYAIANQPVFAYEEDGIGGRIYYNKDKRPDEVCPEFDWESETLAKIKQTYPEYDALRRINMINGTGKGHITWRYDRILELGVTGLYKKVEEYLAAAKDDEAKEFYRGVLIMLDALLEFNDKHIAAYEELGLTERAERMKRVPRYPAESFRDAVQAYFMQHIVVMRENPFGGNSPGRLDYFLWPYLERDLARGTITLDEAKEVIEELFLRIDERVYNSDGWGETIVIGGTKPDGTSGVNPLTYIMIDALMAHNITHPLLYVRVPKERPRELIDACVKYLAHGHNRAQILYDPPIITALTKIGIPFEDAANFYCGGCMEVGIQGSSSDFLYIGWVSIPKMVELMITGGRCLLDGAEYPAFNTFGGLTAYSDFESFYLDFTKEMKRLVHFSMMEQDMYTVTAAKNRPSFLLSSMLCDCLEKGRSMHAGGIRYHDYGATPLGMPNAADALFAVKRAVFDLKICTAEELVSALKANFDGYEPLRAKLKKIPKYGEDNDEADAFAARLMSDVAEAYHSYTTVYGGHGKPVVLTFTYAPEAARKLGARADGSKAGTLVAHGITPSSASMTKGVTAAVNSVGKIDNTCFSGGATTMWDFDSSFVTDDILRAVLETFIDNNGQMFQGNTTSVDELIAAKANPENYHYLIVRVGGYSARFVHLRADLQDEIINRMRHSS